MTKEADQENTGAAVFDISVVLDDVHDPDSLKQRIEQLIREAVGQKAPVHIAQRNDPWLCYEQAREVTEENAVCAGNTEIDIDLDDPDEPRM